MLKKWQSPNSKKCLKIYFFSSASIIISMFDLHTVHLKCFCSFMCLLNVFQTYIKNLRHTQDRRTDRQTDGRTHRKPTPYVSLPLRGETKSCLKSTLGQVGSRFEHCSESLIYHLGSHACSLFAPFHMES